MKPRDEATVPRRLMLREAYLTACQKELQVLKPGNVSVFSEGHGMRAADFIMSAEASVTALTDPELQLGEKIYRAVEATKKVVGCNTNLGIILLCAPVMQAYQVLGRRESLHGKLREILKHSDINDAAWVYHAIRLASPGGLGRSDVHDVHTEPAVTLLEAMRAAAHRDRIANQYACGYRDIFEFSFPRLQAFQAQYNSEERAVVMLFLELLSRFPDSHIARKYGMRRAKEVSSTAAGLTLQLKHCKSDATFIDQLRRVDTEFKMSGVNPGTTADLTVVTLLIQRSEELLTTEASDLSGDLNHNRSYTQVVTCFGPDSNGKSYWL